MNLDKEQVRPVRLLCQLQKAQVGNDFMKNNLPGELIRNKLSFFKHPIILYILKLESEFLSFYFCVHVSVYARAYVSCTHGGQSSPSPFVSLWFAVCVHRLVGLQVWGSLSLLPVLPLLHWGYRWA